MLQPVTATRPDGTLQATLYVLHLATGHKEVRDETMSATAKGGGLDFGLK